MIASAMLPIALLTAQAAALDAGAPDAELSQQFDEILTAPVPPSEVRQTPAPASTGLLNPDISVIFDGVAGAANRARASSAGDDPDFSGAAGGRTGGFAVQEVEIGFQSNVDPFFTARVYLTIPNLAGLEVEEAYAQTTALPHGLQVKAGIFRSAVGRQNEQHLHTQDFSLRPLCNQAYLGTDGLRSPGAQVSWLLPVDVFLRLSGEILSVAPGAGPTFGGSLRGSPTFLGNLKLFLPVNESWSVYLGYTVATGHAPPPGFTEGADLVADGPRSELAVYDLYLKYRPPNRVRSYFGLALQAEYFWRKILAAGESPAFVDTGAYAQLVLQLSRRWHTGGRFDQVGLARSERQPRGARVSAMAMFTPSEFSRLRLQGQREKVDLGGPVYEALLLLEFAIGAHGAHPF
jgi:hypothetical protein